MQSDVIALQDRLLPEDHTGPCRKIDANLTPEIDIKSGTR